MLVDSQVFPENIELRAESNLKLDDLELGAHTGTTNPSVTARARVQACQLRNERGLASAVGTEKSEELTRLHMQRDVLVGDLGRATIRSRVDLPDVFCNQRISLVGVFVDGVDELTLRLGILVLVDELIFVLVSYELRVVAKDLLVQLRAQSPDEALDRE